MFSGTFLAPDSGGYFIAAELADDPRLALFSGLIVASVIGGVISFTIPFAYNIIEKEDAPYLAVGVLSGFIFDPIACFVGGLAMGLSARTALINLIPVALCALLCILGLYFIPHMMIRMFRVFARVLTVVITIGLAGAAFEQMTDFVLIPGMNPIQNGFSTIGIMTLVLAGALTLLYTLRVVLRRPLAWLGTRLGVNDVTMVALVISLTSITPAYAMFKDMNVRGKVVIAAFSASMANMFGAHLGFASATDPSVIGPMFLSKVVAGVFAIPTALFFCRRLFAEEEGAERSAATPR
jgi:ethanolamine transporter